MTIDALHQIDIDITDAGFQPEFGCSFLSFSGLCI